MIEQVALADGTANASTGAATPASQSATQQVGTLFDLLLAALARQGAPPGNQASARTATAGGELHGGDSSDNLEAEADGITGKLTAALMAALGATGGARAVPKDTGSTTASATAKAPNSKLEALYAELGLEYSAGAPDLTLSQHSTRSCGEYPQRRRVPTAWAHPARKRRSTRSSPRCWTRSARQTCSGSPAAPRHPLPTSFNRFTSG